VNESASFNTKAPRHQEHTGPQAQSQKRGGLPPSPKSVDSQGSDVSTSGGYSPNSELFSLCPGVFVLGGFCGFASHLLSAKQGSSTISPARSAICSHVGTRTARMRAGPISVFDPGSQIQQLARRTSWHVICINRERHMSCLTSRTKILRLAVSKRFRSAVGALSALTVRSSS